MTQPNSTFYLDYKVPRDVLRSETAPVPTPKDVIADKVNETTEDIRQIVAFKAWSYFLGKGLIEGDSEDRENRFRELLDDETYRGFIYTMRKHTKFNELRKDRMEGASIEKQIYDSALTAVNIVTEGGSKPLNEDYASRLVSLDLMVNTDFDGELNPDPDWDEPFEAVEGREDAINTLNTLLANPDTAEAVKVMREMQHKKSLGLPTNTDADKSKLKRLRQQTGLPLKVAYLN